MHANNAHGQPTATGAAATTRDDGGGSGGGKDDASRAERLARRRRRRRRPTTTCQTPPPPTKTTRTANRRPQAPQRPHGTMEEGQEVEKTTRVKPKGSLVVVVVVVDPPPLATHHHHPPKQRARPTDGHERCRDHVVWWRRGRRRVRRGELSRKARSPSSSAHHHPRTQRARPGDGHERPSDNVGRWRRGRRTVEEGQEVGNTGRVKPKGSLAVIVVVVSPPTPATHHHHAHERCARPTDGFERRSDHTGRRRKVRRCERRRELSRKARSSLSPLSTTHHHPPQRRARPTDGHERRSDRVGRWRRGRRWGRQGESSRKARSPSSSSLSSHHHPHPPTLSTRTTRTARQRPRAHQQPRRRVGKDQEVQDTGRVEPSSNTSVFKTSDKSKTPPKMPVRLSCDTSRCLFGNVATQHLRREDTLRLITRKSRCSSSQFTTNGCFLDFDRFSKFAGHFKYHEN
ncbi:hypothetical protein BD410DRAFT_809518 [Rickenella mellea]|uniref:Uncharacterized protein n=1 Tax=Rickenella mellea TaxID=50990 RepID=A0A4Y7PHY1_9AGAM|nr:hypothetical protein BD410DRAFT_809518 [Rickenella mellea]